MSIQQIQAAIQSKFNDNYIVKNVTVDELHAYYEIEIQCLETVQKTAHVDGFSLLPQTLRYKVELSSLNLE